MQTVLVAGGAGFIGSNICLSLLNKDYKVICVDNLVTGEKANIQEFLSNPNFSFVEKDVNSKELGVSEKIDFIFHLASPASPNKNSDRSYMAFPIETLLVNSLGTYNLLELAKKNNSKLLFASSSEVYGDPSVSPQPEEYFGNVNPNGPRSVYDEAKRFGEAIAMAYVRKFDQDVRIARIFNTYGPKMRADDGRVVSNFINQAIKNEPLTIYGDGKQTRSFCYIDDMVLGLEAVMFTQDIKGEVINLGNPDEMTIMDFANLIKKLSSSNSEIKFAQTFPIDDPHRRCPNIQKAKKILGWEPKVTLEEGIKKTIDYFRT